jgi:hypothetical protein
MNMPTKVWILWSQVVYPAATPTIVQVFTVQAEAEAAERSHNHTVGVDYALVKYTVADGV